MTKGNLFLLLFIPSLLCISLPLQALAGNDPAAAYLLMAQQQEEPDSIIHYANLAIHSLENSERWEELISAYNLAGNQYFYQENYEKAGAYFSTQYALADEHLSEQSEIYSEAVASMAVFYEFKENYTQAISMHTKALALSKKQGAKKNTAYIAANIGFFYQNIFGDHERAVDYYKHSLQVGIDTLGPKNIFVGIVKRALGGCLQKQNKTEQALEAYRQSLEIFNQPHLPRDKYNEQTRWYIYQGMAEIYLQKKQYPKALSYAKKALKISTTFGSIFEDYRTFQTLGDIYLIEGKTDKALAYFEKATSLARKEPRVHKLVESYSYFAKALADIGKEEVALDSLQKALSYLAPDFKITNAAANPSLQQFFHYKSALEAVKTKGDIFYRLYHKAISNKQFDATFQDYFKAKTDTFHKLHRKSGQSKYLEASFECYQLASQIIRKIRQTYSEEISKNFLAQQVLPTYERSIDVALQLYQIKGDPQYLEQAFAFSENNKSVSLMESLQENSAKGFGNIPDSLLQIEQALKAAITVLNKKVYEAKKESKKQQVGALETLSKELFQQKEKYNLLIEGFEKTYPKYYSFKHQSDLASVSTIQESILDERSALLEYFVGEESIFLFCITQQDLILLKIPNDPALYESFSTLQQIVSTPPSSKNYAQHLAQFNQQAPYLFQQLLHEGLSTLPTAVDKLIIIPDDFLNYLPFEILLSSENTNGKSFALTDQPYLFENFQISYNYSASLLLKNYKKHHKSTIPFVGFAPAFAEYRVANTRGCENGDLYSLQCNKQEIEAINQLIGGQTFIYEDASKENFNQLQESYDVLHLATHACLDTENPQYNRFHFTDGFVTNYDLANRSIKANLVVLSACNTSAGKLIKGDGVMSLAKGFTLAGCPSTLTSLWSVDDCSTAQIMVDFYSFLKEGKSKDQSLQLAKLKYFENADRASMHPYFWAPFLQFGNTSTLNQTISLSWTTPQYGLGILFSLLLVFFLFRFFAPAKKLN